MAGIGFELKKIFKKNSVVSKLQGASYAAMTTIGPLILVISTLFLMYAFLGYSNVIFASKELLASTILYMFIFSLITASPFNSVLSRYLADKIFENEEQHIMPAYYAGLAVNIILSAALGIVFCLWEWSIGKVDAFYVLFSYCGYIGLVFVFYNMLYISALKEYKKITAAFVVGMFVALILSLVMVKVFGSSVEFAVIVGFAVGFLIIGFTLYTLVKKYFKENSRNYTEVFGYFKLHWRLILTNTFYILGLYVHNFIFWTTSLRIVVVKSFVSAPVYDMATCIAMFISISTMVIFIVEVETNFHDKYQNYCQTILGGTMEDINYARDEMFRTIKNELFFIIQLQVIFCISIFLICILILPHIGIGGLILTILPALAVAYFVIFLMYCLVIFIYYFNVYNRAMITTAIFFGVTFFATLITKNLHPALYGLGVLLGAFAGFGYAFYSIRYIEKNLEHFIFCKGKIVKQIVDKEYGQQIFDNKEI